MVHVYNVGGGGGVREGKRTRMGVSEIKLHDRNVNQSIQHLGG